MRAYQGAERPLLSTLGPTSPSFDVSAVRFVAPHALEVTLDGQRYVLQVRTDAGDPAQALADARHDLACVEGSADTHIRRHHAAPEVVA